MNITTQGSVPVLVVIIVMVLAGGVLFFLRSDSSGSEQAEVVQTVSNESVAQKTVGTEEPASGEGIESASTVAWKGSILAGSQSPLLDFTKADYDAALGSQKLVVLYFYANWCPLCKAETAEALYPAFDALDEAGVIGFRVSYNDNETDADEKVLAREFGVGYQHTKVIVKDGKRILKSPEGWNTERYIREIKKALSPQP